MRSIAIVFFFVITCVTSYGDEVVRKITNVEPSFLLSTPWGLQVNATGEVPSSGHSNVRLERVLLTIPPSDGIQPYRLTAEPPTGPAAQVVTPVSAVNGWPFAEREAPWLRGVQVEGIDDGVLRKMLSRRVRRNVKHLSSEEIATLRRGVKAMKERMDSDPTSWTFQARIHGTNIQGGHALWSQCDHGDHFLTWHRLYLLHFEEILREATGDAEFTLPYWDWLNDPVLPLAFRVAEVDGEPNPLFDPTRFINDGVAINAEFLRGRVDAANENLDFDSFTTAINRPHGNVHMMVNGNMSAFATAARDPIFWLHHCNVDRLWDDWLNRGGGRANREDSPFTQEQFSFAGADGSTVTDTVGNRLFTSQLGHNYDTVMAQRPSGFGGFVAAQPAAAGDERPARVRPIAANSDRYKVIASLKPQAGVANRKRLGFTTTRVELASNNPAEARQRFARIAPEGNQPKAFLIRIAGISFEKPPGFTYAVYLNLPEGEENQTRRNMYLLGTLDLFSASHQHDDQQGFTETFDATKVIANLKAADLWKDDKLNVEFVPVTGIAPTAKKEGYEQKLKQSAEAAKLKYQKVEILSRN